MRKPASRLGRPQLSLLNRCAGSLQVNGQLQTSDPDVYAIGDIALYPQPQYNNETTRMEHVQVRPFPAAPWRSLRSALPSHTGTRHARSLYTYRSMRSMEPQQTGTNLI